MVREQTAIESIRSYAGESVPVHAVIDPTLLVGEEVWRDLSSDTRAEEDYVFVYTVGERARTVKTGKILSRKLGCKLVVLQQNYGMPVVGATNLYDISPLDFLSYIRGAKYVVTSSFHGLCFAIQFNKPFVVCLNSGPEKRNSRIVDLLKTLRLENRIASDEDVPVERTIDWVAVNSVLGNERSASRNRLLESLRG